MMFSSFTLVKYQTLRMFWMSLMIYTLCCKYTIKVKVQFTL